uniref:Uncharacterized protein n=1 Tax=Anguilla anguilla TaxID=7936 RepID=A0A0E9W027_ANGAN
MNYTIVATVIVHCQQPRFYGKVSMHPLKNN